MQSLITKIPKNLVKKTFENTVANKGYHTSFFNLITKKNQLGEVKNKQGEIKNKYQGEVENKQGEIKNKYQGEVKNKQEVKKKLFVKTNVYGIKKQTNVNQEIKKPLNEEWKNTILKTLKENQFFEKVKTLTNTIFRKRNTNTNEKITKIKNFMKKIKTIYTSNKKISILFTSIFIFLTYAIINYNIDDVLNFITNIEKYLYTLKYTYKIRLTKAYLNANLKLYQETDKEYDELIVKLQSIDEKIDEIIKEKFEEEYEENKINIISDFKEKIKNLNWIFNEKETNIEKIFGNNYTKIKNNIDENGMFVLFKKEKKSDKLPFEILNIKEKNLDENLSNTFEIIDDTNNQIKDKFTELFTNKDVIIEEKINNNNKLKNIPENEKELMADYIRYGIIIEREKELNQIGEKIVNQMNSLNEQEIKIKMINDFEKYNKKEIERIENLKIELFQLKKETNNLKSENDINDINEIKKEINYLNRIVRNVVDDKFKKYDEYKKNEKKLIELEKIYNKINKNSTMISNLESEISNKANELKIIQGKYGYYNENHVNLNEFKENQIIYKNTKKDLTKLSNQYIKLLNKHVEEKKQVKLNLVKKENSKLDKVKHITLLFNKIINKAELANKNEIINILKTKKRQLDQDEYDYVALRIAKNVVETKIKNNSYFNWIPSINVGNYFKIFSSKPSEEELKKLTGYSNFNPDTLGAILKTIISNYNIDKFNEYDIKNIKKLEYIKSIMEGTVDKKNKILIDNITFTEKNLFYDNFVKKSINYIFNIKDNKNKYLSRDEAVQYILKNNEYPRVVHKYYYKNKNMYRNTSGFLNNTYLFLRYFDKGFSKYIVNYLQTEKIPKKDTIEILEKLAKKKHLSNYDIAIELEKLNTK